MSTRVLILAFLSAIFIKETPARLTIADVNLVFYDREYINAEQTFVNKTTSKTTFALCVDVIKALPKNITFVVYNYEFTARDVIFNVGYESVQICNLTEPNRWKLPGYLLRETNDGRCLDKKKYEFPSAGLFKSKLPQRLSASYIFVSSNEIVIGDRIILKYDVVLEHELEHYQRMNMNFGL